MLATFGRVSALVVFVALASACGSSVSDPLQPSFDSGADAGAGDAGAVDDGDDAEADGATEEDVGEADADEADTGQADTGETDTGQADTGQADTGQADAGEADAGEADTGETDTGETDAGETDTGETDTGETDTGETDTGETDAGETDAGETDAGETDADEALTGSVRLCMLGSEGGVPNDTYPSLVVNGSWNDWAGWGVVLEGPDDGGRYCGVLEGLLPGAYQYVHAGTGEGDEWSGWGTTGNAPLGSACDVDPTDEFGNFGFTIVAGETVETCNRWDDCGCDDPPLPCSERPGRAQPVTTEGYQILIDGVPQHWKGASWAPTPIGGGPGFGPYWSTFLEEDADLMQAAGINVVKTYGPITDVAVLDTLWAHGIGVLPTVFYGGGNTIDGAIEAACAVKDHPAILGWVVGNEWNYNRLDRDISVEAAEGVVEEVVQALQAFDSTRPILSVYGGLPNASTLARLDEVDVWGLNVYTGASFLSLFDDWAARSDAPMFFAEYGADAFDGRIPAENETYQADVTRSLTTEIHVNAAVNGAGVCSGGTIFEWSDEWWKFNGGAWDEHDTTPSWENGWYADPGMHEEWWGLVRIDRTTRAAYDVYASLAPPAPGDDPIPTTGSVEICAQVVGGEVPTEGYDTLVANGSWNDWAGFGAVLEDPDADGIYCGVVEELAPGSYEFVFAQTGLADEYSGWGSPANAPLGSACDWNPDDDFANWGFTVNAGVRTNVCNGWGRCGCE